MTTAPANDLLGTAMVDFATGGSVAVWTALSDGGAKAARLVWRQGNSLWILTAEGDSPDKLLEQIAATWRWTS